NHGAGLVALPPRRHSDATDAAIAPKFPSTSNSLHTLSRMLIPVAKICKILLVEDQPELQDLLSELFASEGFRFIIVGDGPAMRRALAAAPEIDVVIIDMLLPGGVPGLTLANEVRARGLPA